MAKKYNKGRKQKPNFSKRNRGRSNMETASELSPENKSSDKKSVKQNEQSPTS
jgi:hypothetical protein